jgi:general secretion pathway protein F
MDKVEEDIKEGKALSESLEGLFPEEVVDIIAVGEESGNLERSLLNLAESYEKELDYTLKFATQLLEPLLILFVGGIVGIIILAVLLPIFQLNILIR